MDGICRDRWLIRSKNNSCWEAFAEASVRRRTKRVGLDFLFSRDRVAGSPLADQGSAWPLQGEAGRGEPKFDDRHQTPAHRFPRRTIRIGRRMSAQNYSRPDKKNRGCFWAESVTQPQEHPAGDSSYSERMPAVVLMVQ